MVLIQFPELQAIWRVQAWQQKCLQYQLAVAIISGNELLADFFSAIWVPFLPDFQTRTKSCDKIQWMVFRHYDGYKQGTGRIISSLFEPQMVTVAIMLAVIAIFIDFSFF